MAKRVVLISLMAAATLFAHCDSLDGPVVQAARLAIASGDVNHVLPWVRSGDEAAVRDAFGHALSVRRLSASAEKLADTWFFETLVRIHRAGEGAPYDGLKPAGTALPAAVSGADQALASGDLQLLERHLTVALQHGLRERFARALKLKGYDPGTVSTGREYVAAYVDFIHFAERLGQSLGPAGEHARQHVH